MSKEDPYELGMLEEIAGVNFGGAPALLLTVNFRTHVIQGGGSRPTPPTSNFRFGTGEALLDKQETNGSTFTPQRIEFNKFFFAWNPSTPFPTLANYQTVLFSAFPPIVYATQFARVIEINFGGFTDPQNRGVPPPADFGGDGFFPTLAAAQQYAAAWNSVLALHTASMRTIADDGSILGPFGFAPCFAAEIDQPITILSSGQGILRAKYLIKVPASKTTKLILTPGNRQGPAFSADVSGQLYFPGAKKIGSLRQPPAATDSDSLRGSSFTITTGGSKAHPILIIDGGSAP